jgi:UDP-N-acetylmuramoyl-L-alanyl-D-glutamate--2,6-diaminopimelate ligase
MLLSKLLKNIVEVSAADDCEIMGLALDSRLVKNGDLFLAYPGATGDGRNYLADAIQQGARAIISEAEGFAVHQAIPVPLFKVPKLQKQVTHIAGQFYNHPSAKMKVIGVTGTNGKSSISYFIAEALRMQNIKCGLIGTLGSGFWPILQYGTHTTPDPISLQQLMHDFYEQHTQAVAMEVSSHGLDQGRVDAIQFYLAVFTNLTRDHLDYHGSMENYRSAKKRLFSRPSLKYAVINADDDFGLELIEEFFDKLPIVAYTAKQAKTKVQTISAYDIKLNAGGFTANISSHWGEGILHSKLLGRFNLSNLLVVLAVLGIMGIPFSKILESLAALKTAPGRMEILGGGKKTSAVVDFAHTPDALEKVLLTLREHCFGKIWCVFGCGGDRDRGKRPLMGRIAERFSDHLIITDDNPRTEDPEQITNDILQGMLYPRSAEVKHDRHAAIAHAIKCAMVGDVVLIAGKGHEPWQIIGKEKLLFNDTEEVLKVLG